MTTETYICSKCKIEKPIYDFGKAPDRTRGHKSQCKSCCSDWQKKNKDKLSVSLKEWTIKNKDIIKSKKQQYYIDNKERINTTNKKWRDKNKDKCKKLSYEFYTKNKDSVLKRHILNNANKFRNDTFFRIADKLRQSIRLSFKKRRYSKNTATSKILGCSFDEFIAHIESKFEPWMNWDNHGKYNGNFNYGWDLDHIIPISSGVNEDDIIKLNHYSNFQPLCSYVNRVIKRDKLNYKVA